MIVRACTICAAIAQPGTNRCEKHPQTKRSSRIHRRNSQHAIDNATTCWRCGKRATHDDPFERDHVEPLANGGSNEPTNYQAAHRSCNRRAGAAITNGAT